MQFKTLGSSGLSVSTLCLGTMTYGVQTPQDDAFAQMDMAVAAGINFFDTAEMYPVNPITPETQGDSERIVGAWFKRSGKRRDVILATKHSGNGVSHVRDGADISSASVRSAVEGSLKRLGTDYIDLYQLHWPNRGSYMFRQNWTYDPSHQDKQATLQHMADTLGALQAEVDRGTIRHFGLSNESAWGTTKWCDVATGVGGPRVVSIQNEYSLLCRLYDTDLAEVSVNEVVALIPFSPLAAGLLTGKYQNGAIPKGSRMDINGTLGGRKTDRAFQAVAAYQKVAQDHGLDLAHMALAWSVQRPFVASSIFGATTVEQLAHLLKCADLVLDQEVLDAIDAAHHAHPMPY
ncbi:aldo/keto reductase [Nereida sp. MMG025]|uniref:aldo/keto reductase n=1 Tax=Nereida sp. MMG025 TaxID=2909981 RepID=UPI001F3C3DDA|nr:aldo/keto reductase [Nereida sp. MMG025]MCF6445098.1 aldo/keto reductase [Nereida sp. MMG025]